MAWSSLKFLILCVLAPSWRLLAVASSEVEYDCTLSPPEQLDDGLTLEQVRNSDTGTYTMRLVYSGGQSWVGIGVNKDGSGKMVPATAIIGRAPGEVLKYDMFSDAKDGSGVSPMSEEQQTLMNATFTQTETESILQFTQYIEDVNNPVINDDTSWIFAVGLPDNVWEGKHTIRGSFSLLMTDNCRPVPTTPKSPTEAAAIPVIEEEEKEASVAMPATPTAASDTANTPVIEEEIADETGVEDPTAVAEDIASENLDNADVETSAKEDGATEEATTDAAAGQVTSTNSASTTTSKPASSSTKKPASSSTKVPASATTTSATAGLTMRDTTMSHREVWVAHGWLLALAWGLLVPLSTGAAILRHAHPLLSQYWYPIHVYCNASASLMTIVGFALAVWATGQEGEEHFTGDVHHQAGLAIFILVVMQAVVAQFRPALPSKQASANDGPQKGDKIGNDNDDDNDNDNDNDTDKAEITAATGTIGLSFDDNSEEIKDAPASSSTMAKSHQRIGWEIFHRLTGLVLVGLAWYNCQSGYVLLAENFGDEYYLSAIFWVVAAGIAGTVVLLAYFVRI